MKRIRDAWRVLTGKAFAISLDWTTDDTLTEDGLRRHLRSRPWESTEVLTISGVEATGDIWCSPPGLVTSVPPGFTLHRGALS